MVVATVAGTWIEDLGVASGDVVAGALADLEDGETDVSGRLAFAVARELVEQAVIARLTAHIESTRPTAAISLLPGESVDSLGLSQTLASLLIFSGTRLRQATPLDYSTCRTSLSHHSPSHPRLTRSLTHRPSLGC